MNPESVKFPDIDVVKISHFDQLVTIRNAILNKTVPYKTIILDSITEMAKIGMDDIMLRAIKKAQEDGQYRDPDLPSIGEWGKSSNQVRKIVRAFKLLDCHVIMTALSQVDAKKASRVVTKPDLSGKLAEALPGQVDEVFYMYVKDEKIPDSEEVVSKRFILTAPHNNTFAKDRSTNLPMVVKEPTMRNIYDTITGNSNSNNESDD